MRYFKVYQDFKKFVPIDETEIEKALYAFQESTGAVFKDGAVSRVESVIPDLNKSLGWYSDYVPNQDDNADIDRARKEYAGFIGMIKDKIQYLIANGKEDLIGKNVEIPELSAPKDNPISGEIKSLSDKFKI